MSRKLFTKLFWLDAVERAVVTALEVPIAMAGANGLGWLNVDVKSLAAAAVFGAALSLAKSIVAAAKADTDTASLTVDTKPMSN